MRIGKQRQDDQDQPAPEHHDKEDDQEQCTEDEGEPSADLTDGAERGPGNDARTHMGDCPGKGRGDVHHRKTREIHAGHPGNSGDDRFDAGHEAAEEHALTAMAFEELFAADDHVLVLVERPHALDLVLEAVADPVGDGVPGCRSERCPDEERHRVELAKTDKRSRTNKHNGCRHEKSDDEQRFAHGGKKTDQPRQPRVFGNEGQNGVYKICHGRLSV